MPLLRSEYAPCLLRDGIMMRGEGCSLLVRDFVRDLCLKIAALGLERKRMRLYL